MAGFRLILPIFIGVILTSDTILTSVIECETDGDCIDDATCTDNLCQCPEGFVFSLDGYQCLRHSIGYQSECEDDAQCSYLMGRHYCNSGVCDCDTGYRYLHGRCVIAKGLGESCTRDEECHVSNYFDAMICSDENICVCNEGYYARGDYDCRPEVTEINGNCALDMDCMMDDAFCDIYQCTAITTRGARIESKSNVSETRTDIATYVVGASCATSADCSDVLNSVCSPLTKECVCRRGYFLSGSSCIGELGTDVGCTQNSDCPITPRLCRNGACVCPTTHYHNAALTGCLRVAYTPDFPCVQDLSCHIFGEQALCVDRGFERFCSCPLGYALNEETYLCEGTDGEVCDTGACVVSSDCSIVNAVCINGLCGCDETDRLEENTCLPNVGGACDANTRICDIENADCVDDVCSCDEGFTGVDDTTCMQVSAGLYDSCEYDIQCSFVVADSECVNGQCQCASTFTEKDGACLQAKAYGDYCVNLQQCQVLLGDNIQCRNSICQCPADMVRSSDGLSCRDDAPTLKASTILIVAFIIYLIQ
ncbi:EB module [Popillia japonica]|uniref:EB module n=1 Tax=Popillia japonica TaxID=7064 RepID=A0AAW1KRW9_POPJA